MIWKGEGILDLEFLTALLPFLGSLVGTFGGILAGSKLTNYRLKQLEQRVQAHNGLVERTYKLEGQMTECVHDIRDLKEYHKPQKTT